MISGGASHRLAYSCQRPGTHPNKHLKIKIILTLCPLDNQRFIFSSRVKTPLILRGFSEKYPLFFLLNVTRGSRKWRSRRVKLETSVYSDVNFAQGCAFLHKRTENGYVWPVPYCYWNHAYCVGQSMYIILLNE